MAGVGTPALLVYGRSLAPHLRHEAVGRAGAAIARTSSSASPRPSSRSRRKVVKSLPETVRVVTLAEAPGIELLDVRTGDTFEAHQP